MRDAWFLCCLTASETEVPACVRLLLHLCLHSHTEVYTFMHWNTGLKLLCYDFKPYNPKVKP